MASAQTASVTLIVGIKDGVDLQDPVASSDPAAQSLMNLASACAGQPGHLSQYWGRQVETPNLFVWMSRWKSFQHHHDYVVTAEFQSLMKDFGDHVFDVTVMPPRLICIRLESDPEPSLKAPVTELGFFSLPNGSTAEARAAIEEALGPTGEAVVTYGKALGSSGGWGFEKGIRKPAESDPNAEMLVGIFGYDSIETHMQWRAHPEHEKAVEAFADLEAKGVSLRPAAVPGNDLTLGYFHVHFSAKTW